MFDLAAVFKDYVLTPGFGMTCAIVFILCAVVFEDLIPDLAKKYKRLTAVAVGAIFGLLLVELSVTGFIVGAFAGFSVTYAVAGVQATAESAVKNAVQKAAAEPQKTTTDNV